MRVPDAYLTGERTKACGFFALCPTERCACPHSFAFAGRVRSCRQGRTRQSAHASLRMSVQGLCRTGRAEQRRAKKFSLYEPQVHTEGLHAHKLAGKNVRGNWQGPGETLRMPEPRSSGLREDKSLRLMRGPCSTGQRQARGKKAPGLCRKIRKAPVRAGPGPEDRRDKKRPPARGAQPQALSKSGGQARSFSGRSWRVPVQVVRCSFGLFWGCDVPPISDSFALPLRHGPRRP